MKKPLSDKQYAVKFGGKICPNCGGQRIICFNYPKHGMHCFSCYAEWEEMYLLCGYRNLRVKEENK